MEFQAIVMAAGKGSHLADISSNFTKTLLPIANRPMIWYPINMLEKAGFQGKAFLFLTNLLMCLYLRNAYMSAINILRHITTVTFIYRRHGGSIRVGATASARRIDQFGSFDQL